MKDAEFDIIWGDTIRTGRSAIEYKKPATYQKLIQETLPDEFIRNLELRAKAALVQSSLRDMDYSNVWSNLFKGVGFPIDQMANKLALAIHDKNLKIRVYHGTCPISVKPFYRRGILPSDMSRTWRRVAYWLRKLRADAEGQNIGLELIRSRRKQRHKEGDENYVFAVYDDRDIAMWNDSHYVSTGSEEFCSFFSSAELSEIVSNRYPTVIMAEITARRFHFSDLQSFSEALLSEWTRYRTVPDEFARVIGKSPLFHSGIKPEEVCGHYHPSRVGVRDVNRRLHTTKNTNDRCPICTRMIRYPKPYGFKDTEQ